MSAEVAIYQPSGLPESAPLALASMTLDEIAELIQNEHQEVAISLASAVQHAIRAGEALLVAKALIGPDAGWDQWKSFLKRVGVSASRASSYMRVARYREHIPPTEMRTIRDAAAWVRGLPDVTGRRGVSKYPELVRKEALRLRTAGLKLEDVSALLGVSMTAINEWERPELSETRRRSAAKSRARQQKAAEALQRLERDKGMKRVGGAPAEAYSHLRKCMAALQRSIDGAVDPEVKRRMRDAYNAMTEAEDQIARALRVP